MSQEFSKAGKSVEGLFTWRKEWASNQTIIMRKGEEVFDLYSSPKNQQVKYFCGNKTRRGVK